MPRASKRPKPFKVGPVRVRVDRGPHPEHPDRWYWRAEVREAQGQRVVWIGWGTATEVERRIFEMEARGALSAPPAPEPEVQTLRDLLETWLGARWDDPSLSPHTKRTYRNSAGKVARLLGKVRLPDLSLAHLERYRNARLRGASANTVRQEFIVIRAAWKWGQTRGFCPPRALPAVKLPTTKRGRNTVYNRRTPTADDVAAVLATLTGWQRLAVLLLWATGARKAEIANLGWESIDWPRASLTLDGKTGPRAFPLSADLLAEIRAWGRDREHTGPLFGIQPQSVYAPLCSILTAACQRAGVVPFSPHGLRRAAVDRLARAGVDIGTAAGLLGHSPEVMLEHYRGVTMEDRRRGVAQAGLGTLPQPAVAALTEKKMTS